MRKSTRLWLIVAGTLVVLGLLICLGAMATMKWDFSLLSFPKHTLNTHQITEAFTDISISTRTSDVVLVPSDGDGVTVECYESKGLSHTVSVEDGVLTVKLSDTRKWYERLSFGFARPKVTVSLPAGEWGALGISLSTGDVTLPEHFSFDSVTLQASTGDVDLRASSRGAVKITASTGDLSLTGVGAASLELSVSTGKIQLSQVRCTGNLSMSASTGKAILTDVTCNNLTSKADTGDLLMTEVIASGTVTLETDTGDVTLAGCDAAELFITTDTGDVRGTLKSDKVFLARTDTGHVDVPKTVTGGRCEITTDTGDIRLSVE
ncbi:MAG: DUF4097 family beta strand repeat protein [Clostridia bacterium]|nr:DUF4097 family beta strand repeat protein [Clostridia bacterium]